MGVVLGLAVDVYADSHRERWARGFLRLPGTLCLHKDYFCKNPAEFAFATKDVVGPFDSDFADIPVAESLRVGVFLQVAKNFGESERCDLRDLRGAVERNPVQRNQNVEVDVLAGRGVPGAFVATAAFGLRVGDKERARRNFTCRGALLHQTVCTFDGAEKECGCVTETRELPVCE